MTVFEQPPHVLPQPPDGHRWSVTYLKTNDTTKFYLDLIKTKKHWFTGRTIDDRVVFDHLIVSYYTDSVARKVESGAFERILLLTAEEIMRMYEADKSYKAAMKNIAKMIPKGDLR